MWDLVEIRHLVLPAHRSPHVDAPDLISLCIPQRLERDFHFDAPSVGEPSDTRVPNRVPVSVAVALVRDRRVGKGAVGIHTEDESITSVEKRIEPHRYAFGLPEARAVAAQIECPPP